MIRALLVTCVCATALAAIPAGATVLWSGDFRTGDLSQWTREQWAAPNRLAVVTSPTPPGESHALQATVIQGDNPTNSTTGNRNELLYEGDSPQEGDERYYHWQTMWPASYASEDYWQVFTQWHQYITGGSPPLAFQVVGENMMVGDETDHYYWTAPLERGAWHDFVFHVVWSSDPTIGAVELWYDGQHVLPFTHGPTLFPHDTVYLKQGLYRKDVIVPEQTIYHAGMTIATVLSDVMPGATESSGSTAAASSGTTSIGTSTAGATTSTSGATGTATTDATVEHAAGCQSTGAATSLAVLAACLAFARRRIRATAGAGR